MIFSQTIPPFQPLTHSKHFLCLLYRYIFTISSTITHQQVLFFSSSTQNLTYLNFFKNPLYYILILGLHFFYKSSHRNRIIKVISHTNKKLLDCLKSLLILETFLCSYFRYMMFQQKQLYQVLFLLFAV